MALCSLKRWRRSHPPGPRGHAASSWVRVRVRVRVRAKVRVGVRGKGRGRGRGRVRVRVRVRVKVGVATLYFPTQSTFHPNLLK